MRIRVTIATVGLNQMPPSRRRRNLTRANLAEAKFMAVVMALAGSLKVKGGVVPRTMEAPVLSVTMSIVIIVEITKQGNIKNNKQIFN